MMPDRLLKVPGRLLNLPKTAEWLARNILLVGFMALLLLIGFLGYWSRQSFGKLDYEIRAIRDIEINHTRVIDGVSRTAGQMRAYQAGLMGSTEDKFLYGAARRDLNRLKVEMDKSIEDGRNTSLATTKEWADFESAFQEFWRSVESGQDKEWDEKRNVVAATIVSLQGVVNAERTEDDRRIAELSNQENGKLLSATIAVLGVGIVVAFLAFYEIRKILKRLGEAYRETSESRDYLRSLLDSLVSGVMVINQDGMIQTVSESLRKLPGIDLDESADWKIDKVFHNDSSLVEAINDEIGKEINESRFLRRAELGAGRLFDVFASPLVIAEEHRGLILVFVDITETERAQTELRRNRALAAVGQMTAQIAHEIKNPLGSIRFAAEVLKRDSSNREGSNLETIEVVERSVDHLATIVTELSEFARPKELNQVEINLNQLLSGLGPMVADRLDSKQMHLTESFNQNLPSGYFDETELRKLFLNLIINAIDASEPGSEISLITRFNGTREAIVEIVDRGTGMDDKTLRRLFEPFYTTKEKGTGLGMAIAKKIAELHKGDLSVHSKKGKGTTVTVKLPLS